MENTYTREFLAGKNIVVYDLEIKVPINELPNGWESYDQMGISVAALWDYRTMRVHIYMDDNLHLLAERLSEPNTLIVGFNHINFDNRVLQATLYNTHGDHFISWARFHAN